MTPLEEELIELRREIHRHPELAGDERNTAGLVAEQLRAAGLEVTTGVGGNGVLAVLDGSADGPTLAYRADMDAVDTRTSVLPFPPSDRVFDEGFAPRVSGAAHLCGHDLHTAIGVGVARTLAQSGAVLTQAEQEAFADTGHGPSEVPRSTLSVSGGATGAVYGGHGRQGESDRRRDGEPTSGLGVPYRLSFGMTEHDGARGRDTRRAGQGRRRRALLRHGVENALMANRFDRT